MFRIAAGDIPIVQTRKALLVLDLQNDLVSAGCILPVDKPSDFVEKIAHLVPHFRRAGSIIWVRSQFEKHRPFNDGSAEAERIITDGELPSGSSESGGPRRRYRIPSKSIMAFYDKILASNSDEDDEPGNCNDEDESEGPYDNEAFLTPELGKKPRCLIPESFGSNFTQVITQLVDASRDMDYSKTCYSAFKDSPLLQKLRGQFVTELFICGALTNISIFATAMDAARFGYSITLVEDCLGYRSKARHDEAIRQMVETTGCVMVMSNEIIESIRAKENAQSQSSSTKRAVRDTQNHRNTNHMITNLSLRKDTPATNVADKTFAGNASTRPFSEDVPASSDQAGVSNEPIAATSEVSLPGISSLSKKQDGDLKKRVPNKIRTRRRSKASSNDKQQDPNAHNAPGTEQERVIKGPVSPTVSTLAKATEVLEMINIVQGEDVKVEATRTEQASLVVSEKPEFQLNSNANQDSEKAIGEDEECKKGPYQSTKPAKRDGPAEQLQSNAEDDSFLICEGDSRIVHNLLPEEKASSIFEIIKDEVRWQNMSHQGGDVPRLVAVQGEVNQDGSIPIYRHPADESPPLLPFSPAVTMIKYEVEKKLGHKLNHCLIQFYRSGTDYISEHSDKTLDIVPNTFIANVSLGALRTMTFRTKKPLKDAQKLADATEETRPRLSCKVPLPHNSMCKVGLKTNMKWLHGIRQDKRRMAEKSGAELAYDGGRISLTFRQIGTFLNREQTKIWGQGAVAKEKEDARFVNNGETPEAEKMLHAFGRENHSSDFDWQEAYGKGFNVLHISNVRRIFLSGDPVADLRVKLALSEYGLPWAAGEPSSFLTGKEGPSNAQAPQTPKVHPVILVDNDLARARTQGDIAIILYLDDSYRSGADSRSQIRKAQLYTRLLESDSLLQKWRKQPADVTPFKGLLERWDTYATEDKFIAGPDVSIADLAFWPVLHDIVIKWGEKMECPNLSAYHERVKSLDAGIQALGEKKEENEKTAKDLK